MAHEIEEQIPKLFSEGIGKQEVEIASIDEALERLAADGANVSASTNGFIRLADNVSDDECVSCASACADVIDLS